MSGAPQRADAPSEVGLGGGEFDPTRGTYVWHCHIIDHEDNEMMRPYTILPAAPKDLS